MALWIGDTNKRFNTIATRRQPTSINIVICSQRRLRCLNINVIKIQNNVSRMFEQRLISSRRKLPAETYNRELKLLLFFTFSDLMYQILALPPLDTRERCCQLYVMWCFGGLYVFEYCYLHYLSQSLVGSCIQHNPLVYLRSHH